MNSCLFYGLVVVVFLNAIVALLLPLFEQSYSLVLLCVLAKARPPAVFRLDPNCCWRVLTPIPYLITHTCLELAIGWACAPNTVETYQTNFGSCMYAHDLLHGESLGQLTDITSEITMNAVDSTTDNLTCTLGTNLLYSSLLITWFRLLYHHQLILARLRAVLCKKPVSNASAGLLGLRHAQPPGGLMLQTTEPIQLTLLWDNGRRSMLQEVSTHTSCSEVYNKIGLDPRQRNGCFYLKFNGSDIPFSDEPLTTFLVSRHGELRLVGALCGANDGASEAAVPTNDPPSDVNTNLVSMPYTEGILTLLSERRSVEVEPRGYQADEQLIPRLQTAQFNPCLLAVAESGSAFHHEAPSLAEEAGCLFGEAKEALEPKCPTSMQAQYPSVTENIAGAGCLSKPGQIEERKQFLVDKNSSDDIRIDLSHFLKQFNNGNSCLESASNVVVPNMGDQFSSSLTFRQLDGPQAPSLGCNVAVQPYGHLSGSALVRWQDVTYSLQIKDEVRAVRGEGSCYLLAIADAINEADSFPEFHHRRLHHPDLQGHFNERWGKIIAVSLDHDADGLRTIIYSHMLSNLVSFQRLFASPLALSSEHSLIQAEQRAQYLFQDPPCHLRKWAFHFLQPSTHVDERYMAVLLDWLGSRVAIMNLLRVNREDDGAPQFFHVPVLDIIPDTAVLLIKVLNIEHQGRARDGLNHFDCVRNGCPVQFLDTILVNKRALNRDLSALPTILPAPEMGRDNADKLKRTDNCARGGGDSIPPIYLAAQAALKIFDVSNVWGPCQSVSRAERLSRRRAFTADPPGWEWVDAILRLYPPLAQLRAGQIPGPLRVPSTREKLQRRMQRKPAQKQSKRKAPSVPLTNPTRRHKSIQCTIKDLWPQTFPSKNAMSLTVKTPVSVSSNRAVKMTASSPSTTRLDARSTAIVVPLSKPISDFFHRILIPDPLIIPSLSPWIPGTLGLYPNFARATTHNGAQLFPIWNIRIQEMRRQEAMFHAADQASKFAFYIAADVWSRGKKEWQVIKVYGAFRDAVSFAMQTMIGIHRAPTRCFYELIRSGRPCKAYFDLEVEPGVMDAVEGEALCQQVIAAWADKVRSKWPQAEKECPRCLQVLILVSSRMTPRGFKISYHLVYPWLTFPL